MTGKNKNTGRSTTRPIPVAQPVTPAAQPGRAATVAAQSTANRNAASAGPAGSLTVKPKPKENKDDLVNKIPKGKYREYGKAVKEAAKEFGMSENDPVIKGIYAVLMLLGKYAGMVSNFMPKDFMDSLDKGELKKEKFTAEQLKAMRDKQKLLKPADFNEFKLYTAQELKGKSDAELSALYVSSLLFRGLPKKKHISDVDTLAARLKHMDLKRAYQNKTLKYLKKQDEIPCGTVLVFTEGYKGNRLMAYSTGNKDEFVYYKSGMTQPKRFNLKADDCPIKDELQLKAAFSPRYNTDASYFEKHSEELNSSLKDLQKPEVFKKGIESVVNGALGTVKGITEFGTETTEAKVKEKITIAFALDIGNPENVFKAFASAEVKLKVAYTAITNEKARKHDVTKHEKAFKEATAEYVKLLKWVIEAYKKYNAEMGPLAKRKKDIEDKLKKEKAKIPPVAKTVADIEKYLKKFKEDYEDKMARLAIYERALKEGDKSPKKLLPNFEKLQKRIKAMILAKPTVTGRQS